MRVSYGAVPYISFYKENPQLFTILNIRLEVPSLKISQLSSYEDVTD